MVANNQLSLQFDIIVPLGKGKRVHYKVPTYTKCYSHDIHIDGTIKDDSVWTQIHQTYKALANYCPFPMFEEQKESYDFEGVRIWTDIYTRGRYEYYGQTFEGQEFSERFAEIIGSEKLGVEERLKVHTELLAFLRKGMNMRESVDKVLKSIERINSDYLEN